MDEKHISYKSGYKYQLSIPYVCYVEIYPEKVIETNYIVLTTEGKLIIYTGYAWDGPSGPTIDTKTFMRGSLIHDALYQLLREGFLSYKYREQADKELKKACIEDGMCKIRAWYVYKAVRKFAKSCADKDNVKPLLIAP